MVGLSRARFYQLIGSAFPFPLYQMATRRPFFNAEQQQVCLEVRRKNCGIDGKPIMFYARRGGESLPRAKNRRPTVQKKTTEPLAGLLESVHALGLTTATLVRCQSCGQGTVFQRLEFSSRRRSHPKLFLSTSSARIRLIIWHDKWHYQVS